MDVLQSRPIAEDGGGTKCGVKFADVEIDGDGRMEKEKPRERKKGK